LAHPLAGRKQKFIASGRTLDAIKFLQGKEKVKRLTFIAFNPLI
jgi:hypothetical protein